MKKTINSPTDSFSLGIRTSLNSLGVNYKETGFFKAFINK